MTTTTRLHLWSCSTLAEVGLDGEPPADAGGQVRYQAMRRPTWASRGHRYDHHDRTAQCGRPCDLDQQRLQASVGDVLAALVRATVTTNALRLEHQNGTGVSLVKAS